MKKHEMGMHHKMHEGHMEKRSMHGKGPYENETEHPSMPMEGHLDRTMGLHSFKDEADPIAYGQAGMEGCRSDEKKMKSQFKDYHWS